MKYIIGSRGSRLALIQTKYVQEKLAKAYPEHTFEIQIIKTKGDTYELTARKSSQNRYDRLAF